MKSLVTMSLKSRLKSGKYNHRYFMTLDGDLLTFGSWPCDPRKRKGTRMWPCPIFGWCSRQTPSLRRSPTPRLRLCTRNGLCKKLWLDDRAQLFRSSAPSAAHLRTPMHSVSSVLVLHIRAVASSEPVTSMEPSSDSAITLTLSSWSARVSFSVPALLWCEAAAPILAIASALIH